jgi:Flp pilus assembly protein TadD
MVMKSLFIILLLSFASLALAQDQSPDNQPHIRPKNMPKEEQKEEPKKEEPKDESQGESSSKDSEINLEGPGRTTSGTHSDVHLMYPYDPHKAAKDIEVGEYYLKQKNYRAALDRFNEALLYKPNDADATFHLAQTQEKLELYTLAYQNYHSYATLFKEGPFIKDAQDAMKRIQPHLPAPGAAGQSAELAQLIQEGEANLAKNDYEEAHTSFVKAAQLAPDDPVANFRVAESLLGLQRLEEARIFYKKYLALQPNGKMASEAKREIGQINLVVGKEKTR